MKQKNIIYLISTLLWCYTVLQVTSKCDSEFLCGDNCDEPCPVKPINSECPFGFYKFEDMCHPPSSKLCPANETLTSTGCKPVDELCPPSFVYVNGVCVNRTVMGDRELCQNFGICSQTPKCGPGMLYINNTCVEKSLVICPPNYILKNTVCIKCPIGMIAKNDTCIYSECPDGAFKMNGVCAFCPANSQFYNGQCVQCPNNLMFKDGFCVCSSVFNSTNSQLIGERNSTGVLQAQNANVTKDCCIIIFPKKCDKQMDKWKCTKRKYHICGTECLTRKNETFARDNRFDEPSSKNISVSNVKNEQILPQPPVVYQQPPVVFQQPMVHQALLSQQPMMNQASLSQQPMMNQASLSQQPMMNPAMLSQQPMMNQATLSQQPMVNQALMSQQPMMNPAMLSQQPIMNPAMLSQQPMMNQATLSQQPIMNPAMLSQQPMMNQATLSQQPMVNQALLSQQPMMNQAALSQQPMMNQALLSQQPMMNQATMSQQPSGYSSCVGGQCGQNSFPPSVPNQPNNRLPCSTWPFCP